MLVGLIALIAVGFFVVWLIKTYGILGALVVAPLAGAGAAINEIAKSAGAVELNAPKGRPRRGTIAASPADPEPVEGKAIRRTRARRGGSGWRR